MKRFYLKFRVMLMTLAVGLASVFTFNGTLKLSDEVPVNLPQTESGDVMIVFPRCRYEMPWGGGSGSGSLLTSGEIYVSPEKLTKCIENSPNEKPFNFK